MELVEATDAVSVWTLWPDEAAHLFRILDPEGNKFVLIGRRPEPKDTYLAISLFDLVDLAMIAAGEWSELKAA
jgi:hypothetical protein